MVFFSRKEKRLWCSHLNTWRWCLWSRVLPTIVGTKRLEPDTGQGGKMDKDTSGQSFTVTNLEILTPVGKQLHSNVAPQKFHLQNYRLHLTVRECLFRYARLQAAGCLPLQSDPISISSLLFKGQERALHQDSSMKDNSGCHLW